MSAAISPAAGDRSSSSAADRGWLCHATGEGSRVTFTRPDRWLGTWRVEDPDAATIALVRRFLGAYGPATLTDIRLWWGTQPTMVRPALESLRADLVDIELDGRRGIALAADVDAIAATPPIRSSVRLLGPFDPLIVSGGIRGSPHPGRPALAGVTDRRLDLADAAPRWGRRRRLDERTLRRHAPDHRRPVRGAVIGPAPGARAGGWPARRASGSRRSRCDGTGRLRRRQRSRGRRVGILTRPCPRTIGSIELTPPVEKAFLVAVDTGTEDGWSAQDSLAELANLATTAGAEVVGAEWQNRRHVDPNWYVGKGKAEELLAAKRETGFDVLIADDELSPGQQKALESVLSTKVIDRSRLILDIFAQHARTHEGRLQVELAQLEYQLPRLTRLWTHLSRTGGGIGTRGPGESQLETDRRLIRERIKKMKERVEAVRQQRETAARGRDRRLIPTVSIVGYTNAGKSTLLNALVGEDVALAEDKLFATLDPTSRLVKLGDGQTAIVTDTVGFIHKLPHQLVDAFRATLEEVTRADVLVEVVDAADSHAPEHRVTVQAVLDELGAGDKPRLAAFNKVDLLEPAARDGSTPAPTIGGTVFVSAETGYGLEALRGEIAALLASLWEDVDLCVPYAAGELLARVRERGTVELDYRERDVRVHGRVAPGLAGELRAAAARWEASLREADAIGVAEP